MIIRQEKYKSKLFVCSHKYYVMSTQYIACNYFYAICQDTALKLISYMSRQLYVFMEMNRLYIYKFYL